MFETWIVPLIINWRLPTLNLIVIFGVGLCVRYTSCLYRQVNQARDSINQSVHRDNAGVVGGGRWGRLSENLIDKRAGPESKPILLYQNIQTMSLPFVEAFKHTLWISKLSHFTMAFTTSRIRQTMTILLPWSFHSDASPTPYTPLATSPSPPTTFPTPPMA